MMNVIATTDRWDATIAEPDELAGFDSRTLGYLRLLSCILDAPVEAIAKQVRCRQSVRTK